MNNIKVRKIATTITNRKQIARHMCNEHLSYVYNSMHPHQTKLREYEKITTKCILFYNRQEK